MPAPSRIEVTVATSESNEKRNGAAIESPPTAYSTMPCTKSGTEFLRNRRSCRTGGFGEAFTGPILGYAWSRLEPVSTGSATAVQSQPGPPQEVSPRMFDNPILEWGSRVHLVVPPLLY